MSKPSIVFTSNAPEDTDLAELAGVALARHRIESLLVEAKGQVAMTDYEVRSWHGWHRHIVLVLLAHTWLKLLQNKEKEKKAFASMVEFQSGRTAPLVEYCLATIELAHKMGASHEVISRQVTLGWMAANSGNFDKARSYAQACIENNQDRHGYFERWHPYIQMAIVKSVADEDYEAGLRLAQQAHEGVKSADGSAVSSWGISMPIIGLERYQEAAPYVRRWLDWSAGMRQVGAVASFAWILGSTGRNERCTKLLGFCENNSIAGWKDKWSVTHDVIQKAKAELGEEVYRAAFERGKSLNLETVVQELLAEFGEED